MDVSRRLQTIVGHLQPKNEAFQLLETSLTSEGQLCSVKEVPSGVAVITLNNPPVNALSRNLINALISLIQEEIGKKEVKGIVIQGSHGKFSGGADIKGFGQGTTEERKDAMFQQQNQLNSIEAQSKPIVAAIDGFALGGGLELAMVCHARVAQKNAKFGLPELNLGLIPGLGGTQRLPRLIGTAKAIEMMLTSKAISSNEAKILGLVDKVVDRKEDLLPESIKLALELSKVGNLKRSILASDKIERESSKKIISLARKQIQKKYPNVPHPISCLNAVEEGILTDGYCGLRREIEEFSSLVRSPTAEALIHVFFASKQTSRIPGVTDLGLKPRTIKKVAVLGGGTMGSGIATNLILSGITCYLKEVSEKFLEAAVVRVKQNVERRVKTGKLTHDQCQIALSQLIPKLDFSDFEKVDMVIEAVVEDIKLKQKIFSDLEKYCNPSAIFASNTSTIDLNVIGKNTHSKRRIIGTHFFAPAHVMPLLEIIRTEHVDPQVIVDTLGLAKALKKTPIVVGNCAGFTVNRAFFPYSQTAAFLVLHGIDPYRIDRILKNFGMPMGVFEMKDLSGNDVALFISKIYEEAFPFRIYGDAAILSKLMVKNGRLGQKTSRGFYKYLDRKPQEDTQGLELILQEARAEAGNPAMIHVSDEEILQMILFSIFNECTRIVEEGMVVRSSDVDIGSIYGYGFPAYHGGIMKWGEMQGINKVYQKLNHWHNTYNCPLFKPSSILEQKAASFKSLQFIWNKHHIYTQQISFGFLEDPKTQYR